MDAPKIYTGYTETEIRKDKRKNTVSMVILIIFLLFFLFFIVTDVVMYVRDVNIKNVSDISYTDIESYEVYNFDELILIDAYAIPYEFGGVDFDITFGSAENTTIKKTEHPESATDFIALFFDSNDQAVYIALDVTAYSEIQGQCRDYIMDDKMQIGDVILSGAFNVCEIYGSDLQGYLGEAYEHYNEIIPGELLNLALSYEGTLDEYKSQKTTSAVVMGCMFLIPAVGLAIGLFALVRKRRELNSYLEEALERENNYQGF